MFRALFALRAILGAVTVFLIVGCNSPTPKAPTLTMMPARSGGVQATIAPAKSTRDRFVDADRVVNAGPAKNAHNEPAHVATKHGHATATGRSDAQSHAVCSIRSTV